MSDFGIDFEAALVFFKCETCKGTGIVGFSTHAVSLDPDYCYDCSGHREIVVYIGTWLTNLAIGAALCRAFRTGFDQGWDSTGEGHNSEYTSSRFKWPDDYERMAATADGDDKWRPGCQRQAP